MPLVCRKSRQIFDSKYLRRDHKDRYMCPIFKHYGEELIEIDDLLIDPIFSLWKKEINTLFCCAGHLYDSSEDSYVMVGNDQLYSIKADDEKEEDPFENYFIIEKYRKIYEIAKRLIDTKYSSVLRYDPVTYDRATFEFNSTRIQFSVRQQKGVPLFEAQKNLVNFCYDLANSKIPEPDCKRSTFPWKKFNPSQYFEDIQTAALSGECRKTCRGTVLLTPGLEKLSTGTIKNCPACFPECLKKKDFSCTSKHAEIDAIEKGSCNPNNSLPEGAHGKGCYEIKFKYNPDGDPKVVPNNGIPEGSIMMHLKFDNMGNPKASGEKYCSSCVPVMKANNIRYLVLYHEWGWAFYDLEHLEETNLKAR